MNKNLFDTYKKLKTTERSELNYKFKDSPVGLRLIEFLDQCGNRNFKNQDAVSFVYNGEKANYNVLENRYFKLRKKIMDELESNDVVIPGTLLTDEEQKLFRCKNLTLSVNKEEAFKQLTELEKECWQKNIFELLPSIIDQLIFFNQSFNRNEDNKALFKRLEKANVLLYDMNRFGMITRQIYEINYSKGIKHAKKEFNALKEIAVKNPGYPRFLLCYHHISMYYKLGSGDYINEMQVVSRHLSEFKKLYAKHPLMPLLSYKVNYVKYQHFHFNQSTTFYHFNRCEFEEANASMNEIWELVNSSDSIFRMYKTESLYSNMFNIQLLSGNYEACNRTNDHFITFLKENHQQDMLIHAYTQKAMLYACLYPATQMIKMDSGFLNTQVDEYIKKVRKSDNAQLSLDQVLVLKIKLLIIAKNYKKAIEILNEKVVKDHLESLKCHDLFVELITLLMQNTSALSKQFADLGKKVQQRKYKAELPGEYMHLKWLSEYISKLPKMK